MARLLKPVAGDGVAHRQNEEAKTEGQHEQIEHGNSRRRSWGFDADRPLDVRKRCELPEWRIKKE
jgi:hypothetical protein